MFFKGTHKSSTGPDGVYCIQISANHGTRLVLMIIYRDQFNTSPGARKHYTTLMIYEQCINSG